MTFTLGQVVDAERERLHAIGYARDYTYNEIAEMMGKTPGACR